MTPPSQTVHSLATAHIVRCLRERAGASIKPLVVGVSGPQGAGKTTLTTNLINSLRIEHNLRAICFSLDDLYLTFEEQNKLRLKHPNNPYSHSEAILRNRLKEEQWTKVELPIDVILFEGWCLGFKPVTSISQVETMTKGSKFGADFEQFTVENMMDVQSELAKLEQIHKLLDVFIHICAEDIGYVYDWRQQQEDSMREKLGDPSAGLDRDQLRDFVSRFMPLYLICLPELEARGFFTTEAGKEKHLRVVIGKSREVISSAMI
ncbi:hypothetical protein BCR33DRAFT_782571 [Rhizoclosmatium globosum]|uniref:P-loop containing nucleoside triphosphate hydrolase protein n=1 Tax=Rhizoclosmatium globosum TaxID=329046 RepID=A0A1Y2CME2_9FUNG|nr:hypothetical protein BCR33DRAFT_782571 [Rhizoclosmatium globosum]|eukprot:ORY48190.1 hypothetical protein BCR33DRAFT_782571 [Rhizoclosmatium globosum]